MGCPAACRACAVADGRNLPSDGGCNMSERYDNDWIASLLDGESRLGQTAPQELLVEAGIRSAHTVVDIGCGPGFLTFPAAQIVGATGHVYAVDIEQKMIDLVSNEAAARGVIHISALIGSGTEVPLPDGSADFGICALVLHYSPDRDSRVKLLADARRVLRPVGRMLVIDRQLGEEEVGALLRDAGFEHDRPHPLRENAYRIIATRPAL